VCLLTRRVQPLLKVRNPLRLRLQFAFNLANLVFHNSLRLSQKAHRLFYGRIKT
jgi:hypothetical protein